MLVTAMLIVAFEVMNNFPVDLTIKMVGERQQEEFIPPSNQVKHYSEQNTIEVTLPNGRKMLVSK